MKTIKIDIELDYIILGVYENGARKINSRVRRDKLEDVDKLKVAAFDLLWQLKELGQEAEINPYTN